MNQNEQHAHLLRPYDPPLPVAIGGRLPSIPQLWERTKLFFSRVITHIGSTASFSQRMRLTRSEKKEVLGWLEPVEKLARSCLLVRAFCFLMMTPEGRRMMRETPKMAMPSPPKPPGQPSNPHSTKVIMPGWHTIARNWRAAMEQRKRDEAREAERAARDRHDPANWGGGFRVLGWSFPEDETSSLPANSRKPRRVGIDLIEPNPWAAIDSPLSRPASEREKDSPALILARRIETLARVIENPDRSVTRLARFIAKLPREAFEPLKQLHEYRRIHWLHTGRDALLAADHVCRAAAIYCTLDTS
jgi:hypothetical protein